MLGRDANSGDEEGSFGVDNDVDEFIEFALCVIVAAVCVSRGMQSPEENCSLCLSGTATYLRK